MEKGTRFAEAVRQLAHHLHADEPLVEARCDGPGLREAPVGSDRAHQDRGDRAGFDLGEGASVRDLPPSSAQLILRS
jgi:hypothetical protein